MAEFAKIPMNTQALITLVDINGNPVDASGGVTVNEEKLQRIMNGRSLGDPGDFFFRDPTSFRAGELHAHVDCWETIVGESAAPSLSFNIIVVLLRVKHTTRIDYRRSSFPNVRCVPFSLHLVKVVNGTNVWLWAIQLRTKP